MPGRNTIPDRSTTIPKTTGPSSSSANSPPLLEVVFRVINLNQSNCYLFFIE